ncbi:UDP-2,3-diacylglucosamine diphosphatase [Phaeovulum sp. W22_SRMD_FR3]
MSAKPIPRPSLTTADRQVAAPGGMTRLPAITPDTGIVSAPQASPRAAAPRRPGAAGRIWTQCATWLPEMPPLPARVLARAKQNGRRLLPAQRRAAAAPPSGSAVSQPGGGHGPAPQRHRALFLSDLHLGARGCQAAEILAFLDQHSAEVTYLVGDIFDTWRPLGAGWAPAHDAVLQRLMARVRDGDRLVYIPGNHDAFFRRHPGRHFVGVDVADYAYHTGADGRCYLVTHGDSCDPVEKHLPVLSHLGSHAENLLRGVEDLVNHLLARHSAVPRRWRGIDRGLRLINTALRGANGFQARLVAEARHHAMDGIICGHFHQAALHDDHGLIYANCGDWVENCTAIAEDFTGRLMLLQTENGVTAPAAAARPIPAEVPQSLQLVL